MALLPQFNELRGLVENYTNVNYAAQNAYKLFGDSSFFREVEKWDFLSPLIFSPTFTPESVLGIYDAVEKKLYDDGVAAQQERVENTLRLKKKLEDAEQTEESLSPEEITAQHIYEQNSNALEAENELAYKLGLASRPVHADYEEILENNSVDETENYVDVEIPEAAVITTEKPRIINISNDNPTGEIIVTEETADVFSAPPAPPDPRGTEDYEHFKNLGKIQYDFEIKE